MNRRWVPIVLLSTLAVLSLAAWFEPDGRLRGWVKGESFHAGRPTSYWARQLASGDPQTEHAAIWELRDGDEPGDAVLGEVVADKSNPIEVRIQAASLLGHLGPRGKAGVPALLVALDDSDPNLKAVAVRSLCSVAPDEATVANLVPLIAQPQRFNTLSALARVNGGGPAVVEALIAVIEEDAEPAHLALAVDALSIRKQAARPAVAAVVKAAHHADLGVRRRACATLGNITGPDEVVFAVLAARLGDEDAEVRAAAARSLGQFGPAAKSAVAALRKRIDDPDETVRGRVAHALRRIDPAPKP